MNSFSDSNLKQVLFAVIPSMQRTKILFYRLNLHFCSRIWRQEAQLMLTNRQTRAMRLEVSQSHQT